MEKLYVIRLCHTDESDWVERLNDYELQAFCSSLERVEQVIKDKANKFIKDEGFVMSKYYGGNDIHHLMKRTRDSWNGEKQYINVDFYVKEVSEGEFC